MLASGALKACSDSRVLLRRQHLLNSCHVPIVRGARMVWCSFRFCQSPAAASNDQMATLHRKCPTGSGQRAAPHTHASLWGQHALQADRLPPPTSGVRIPGLRVNLWSLWLREGLRRAERCLDLDLSRLDLDLSRLDLDLSRLDLDLDLDLLRPERDLSRDRSLQPRHGSARRSLTCGAPTVPWCSGAASARGMGVGRRGCCSAAGTHGFQCLTVTEVQS